MKFSRDYPFMITLILSLLTASVVDLSCQDSVIAKVVDFHIGSEKEHEEIERAKALDRLEKDYEIFTDEESTYEQKIDSLKNILDKDGMA